MQASRKLQLGLIGSVGALFFLATVLTGSGKVSNSTATAILAGACVVVLGIIALVARKATPVPAAEVKPRTSKPMLVAMLVVGILLIELTQLTALPGWERVTSGVCGCVLAIGSILAMRRGRQRG